MIFNLLSAAGSASGSDAASGGCTDASSWIMIGLLFAIIVVWMIFSRRSQKKKQEEVQNTLNAVRPGNKVKTIGGVCGIVVEVNDEDNTFVLETGSETTGKCFMKFDKQAIYQTDAVAQKTNAEPKKDQPTDETKDETVAPVEAEKTEETPSEEAASEEKKD